MYESDTQANGISAIFERLGIYMVFKSSEWMGHVGRVWSEKLGGLKNSLGPDIDIERFPRGERSLSTP